MARIDSILQAIKEKIKGFVHRKRWHELLIFSFFILLSSGFWLLQSLQKEYEIEVEIPVKYKNIPDSVYFTNTPPDLIKLKLKDKGSVLLNYTIGRKFKPIEIGIDKNSTRKGTIHLTQQEIMSSIMKQILSSTNIQRIEPNEVSINYAPLSKKSVQIVFDGQVETADGFLLVDTVVVNPKEVIVYAQESILDTLNSIKTSYTIIKGAKKDFSKETSLISPKGISLNPSSVNIQGTVEEFTEKTLEVAIICPNIPDNIKLRTFPSSAKISCSMPLSRFKMLNSSDFSINIDYNQLDENINGEIQLRITKSPNWVRRLSITPEKIEFVLEKKNNHD